MELARVAVVCGAVDAAYIVENGILTVYVGHAATRAARGAGRTRLTHYAAALVFEDDGRGGVQVRTGIETG